MDHGVGAGKEYDGVERQEEDDSDEMVEQAIEEVAVGEVEEDEDSELGYLSQWTPPLPGQEDRIIIMGKMSDEYTDWVENELPE